MRVALFSPFPPSQSGIADYSQALAAPLSRLVELECFHGAAKEFHRENFDLALYQVGNNSAHAFVYDMALRHPGVVVMHEGNVHHLIADITIRRGNWDAYLREVEYNGGAGALAHAQNVKAGKFGPDYNGVPMTRRLLESAKALIVHSEFLRREMRAAGFTGPIARIPHGAWIDDVDGAACRTRLGIGEADPLIGIFGHLKPYKRIAESLRAFQRLVQAEPHAKMILAGEPHHDFPIESMIRSLALSAHVRLLGFTPIEDFAGYIAASDIVLNLRYPTVGETSGSLLRALGLARAVLVSEVGAFAELPGDICVKVPIGPGEEDLLFEFLKLLVSRRDLAQAMGKRARRYVERECRWEVVAERYASFLCAVKDGRDWDEPGRAEPEPGPVTPEYIAGWADPSARDYVAAHSVRLTHTLAITPRGGPGDAILEMGAYLQVTPALHTKLGYGTVRGCYYGPPGRVDHRTVTSDRGEEFSCHIDLFDAEKDPFPYSAGCFTTVLCCELIEHLSQDPMHLMSEVNRILKSGGHLVLTTPNIASLRSIAGVLQGYHPGFFQAYLRPAAEGEARHNREYVPLEIHQLLENAGFEVVRLETGPFRAHASAELDWVRELLGRCKLESNLRGECIYAVGRKTGTVRERYPSWLYA